MTWLNPTLALLAAAIALPMLLILYFLKLRRRDVEVSTTLLWKKAIQDLQANAPFQKLRRNILLFLQLLVLAAALFAVAEPQMRTDAPPGTRTILLIDRSASMAATDETDGSGQPISRLELARIQAIEYIDALRSGGLLQSSSSDEAMIIAFDESARVLQTFTNDKSKLRTAVEAITSSDATSNIASAVELANAYAGPRVREDVGLEPGAPLLIWSDGAVDGIDAVELHPETTIEYHALGKSDTANLAITSMRADRSYDRPGEASIFVAIQSTDRNSRTIDVEFAIDGLVASVRSVTLGGAPDPTTPAIGGIVFRLDRSDRAVITARLVVEDALSADDAARIVLPPAKRLSVALVSTGNMFLKLALEGLSLSRLDVLSPKQYEESRAAKTLANYDVIILDGWVPSIAQRDVESEPTSLPAGSYLVFGAVPELPGLKKAPDAPSPEWSAVLNWERGHPALRLTNLASLDISKVIPVEIDQPVQTLAQSTGGPVIVEAIHGATHAIVLPFNLVDSDWPLDYSFVLFLASAIQYLGDEASSLTTRGVVPGDVISTRLPDGARNVSIELPDGDRRELMAGSSGAISFGPIDRTGLYVLRWDGAPGPQDALLDGRAIRVIPANLLSSAESAIGTRPQLEFPTGAVQPQTSGDGEAFATRRLWPWFLLAAVVLIIVEWYIYNRKVHV